MEFKYKIRYDIKKDMWNWRDSLRYTFMGQNWIDNIDNDDDRKIAEQIVGLKKQPAEAILKPYLLAQKNDPNSKLSKFFKIAEDDFRNKFTDACLVLERITKRPMMSNSFTFYITTFPAMPFFYDTCEILMYDSTEGIWGMPIDGFLHEGLHYQFMRYWQFDESSPVSKLSADEFDYLKEALTVILDDELKPLISQPDNSYPSQVKFRNIIHDHWREHHDFDKLVDFGLEKLGDYVVRT